ncbi:MAG: thioredoxin fold domain-containing protein, partial [Gammaproteobacteria bacterium]
MRITQLFLMALLSFSLSVSAQTRDPLQHFFYASFGDLSEEVLNARDAGQKGVMLMFEEDDCPFCARMKKTILNRVDVQEYYRANLRPILIDKELTDE